jgi:hypothetical protein
VQACCHRSERKRDRGREINREKEGGRDKEINREKEGGRERKRELIYSLKE